MTDAFLEKDKPTIDQLGEHMPWVFTHVLKAMRMLYQVSQRVLKFNTFG